jgi:hypothetical protein
MKVLQVFPYRFDVGIPKRFGVGEKTVGFRVRVQANPPQPA